MTEASLPVRFITGAALALLLGWSPLTAAEKSAEKPDLPNFQTVHTYLYRGGEPSSKGLEKLKGMGISTIFDLRNPGEKKIPEKQLCDQLGMNYVPLPMDSHAPTKKQVDTIMTAIKKARSNPDSGAVFVHCAHGSDRTGCIIGIWRVQEDGYSYDQAYKEMRKYYFTPKFTRLSGAVKSYTAKPE